MEGFGQRLDSILEVFSNLNNFVRNTGTCLGSLFISSVDTTKPWGPWLQQREILVPEQCHGHKTRGRFGWSEIPAAARLKNKWRSDLGALLGAAANKQVLHSGWCLLDKERTQKKKPPRLQGRVWSRVIALESQHCNKWFIGLAKQQVAASQSLPL